MELLEDGEDQNDDNNSDSSLPDSITYNSLLYIHSVLASSSIYGERGNATAASHAGRAAALLGRMEGRCCRTRRPESMPDTISYATVLHGYTNAGNAREVERILDHMERIGSNPEWSDRVQTNIICYRRRRLSPIGPRICSAGWNGWRRTVPRGASGPI